MEQFKDLVKIGEGTYGVVYKGIKCNTGEVVALKKLWNTPDKSKADQGIPASSLREVALLKLLSHRNIVQLQDVIRDSTGIYMILDYMDRDLQQVLDSNRANNIMGLELCDVYNYSLQLLEGVSFCHIRRIMHRDLKPANLLIDENNRVLKIADFGLARDYRAAALETVTTEVVTLWYRSPELLLGSSWYAQEVDAWSCGVIIGEMVSGCALCAGSTEFEQLIKIFQVFGTPDEQNWTGSTKLKYYTSQFPKWAAKDLAEVLPQADGCLIKLIERLTILDVKRRFTPTEVLKCYHEENKPIVLESNLKPLQ